MGKIGVSVCIRNLWFEVDRDRMAAALVKHSHLSHDLARKCVQLVMDETAEGTLICMPSLDTADELVNALIVLGLDAYIIDHDAASDSN